MTSATQPDNRPAAAREATQLITDAEVFVAHQGGKLSVTVDRPNATKRDLSIAYTPDVAKVSRGITADPALADTHTCASRLLAVVSDGMSVLGLGDICASASLPVMEGKSALFETLSGLDSIPIVLNTADPDEIVETIARIAPSFGAVNLEDISAPRCFEIEKRLIEALDMPVMHYDQHGTAVVVLAAPKNAAKLVSKELAGLRIFISGAGAAGVSVVEILLGSGVTDVILLDSKGTINLTREDISGVKLDLANRTNPRGIAGVTQEALAGADVFIGVSSSKVPAEHASGMTEDAIIFALSNPDPEITPEDAAKFATVIATGRSDYPNQINNVLAFPDIFRGALDAGARRITLDMKLAPAHAIAALVDDELAAGCIVPRPLDPRVAPAVSAAVIAAM